MTPDRIAPMGPVTERALDRWPVARRGRLTMCCLFTALALLGPRAAIILWWLFDPALWSRAFDTFIWPLLGFIFLPWTTLMFVLVFPAGINGFDFVWLGLAVVFDLFNWFGGAYGNRQQLSSYYRS